ncbi:MAG: hypothetical protein LBJ15_18315 [Comamonas sp.]|jgi:hypothetical protein|uniref:hypothetical protein n=1 Tax=Comamonas sp. TaxID=34028 RepID=UPI0028314735|nr:hypothetical protein [Comamonas sp.]MDR0215932.1 hypothetical protein [Comamonas sp.]
MSDVVSFEHIQKLAHDARVAGTPIEQACPWPMESPAGQAFTYAYEGRGEE